MHKILSVLLDKVVLRFICTNTYRYKFAERTQEVNLSIQQGRLNAILTYVLRKLKAELRSIILK